jgi:prephenate dehydrogenase
VRRDPAAHDLEVAWISHVPHALAFSFARALGDAPPEAGEVAGTGFRDFTRIARSDPELWAEILVANRKAIEGPIARVGRRLTELARAIESADVEELDRWIAEARAALGAHEERRISPDPEAKIRRPGHA